MKRSWCIMAALVSVGCQDITPTEVEPPNFLTDGIWIEVVECWLEQAKDEGGSSLGALEMVCSSRVVFVPSSATTPDEPPPRDYWDDGGGGLAGEDGEESGPTDDGEDEEKVCEPTVGNKNGCLRKPTKDEKGIIDLARGLFGDPQAIADSLVRMWCADAVLGVTQLRNSGNLWVGFNDPSMEPHGAKPVAANQSPNGQPGMHIDDNVIENAITSAKWRRRLARAMLHETWHMWYGGTPLGEHPRQYYVRNGEVRYYDQPYSEVEKCLK